MFDWFRKRRKRNYYIVFGLVEKEGMIISTNSLSRTIYDFCEHYNITIIHLKIDVKCCFLDVKCSEIKLNNIIKYLFGDVLNEHTFIISCTKSSYS